MENLTQPLSLFLETANPILFYEHCPKGTNTSSRPDNYISPRTIYMAAGGRGYLDECAKFRPDRTGTQPTALQPEEARQVGQVGKSWNILPGYTKLGKKWSSNKIVRGPVKVDIKCQWLRPLAQIYTYCVRANVRYGYVITDKELVVFLVCPTPQSNEPAATIEYQVAWPHDP